MSSKLERISQWSIIVIALAAVFVSLWQAKILREHNRLTVKPLMDYSIITNDSLLQHVFITNQGIGPAIVKEITFYYEGTEYQSWNEVLNASQQIGNASQWYNMGANSALSPNANIQILELQKSDYKNVNIEILILYESIYEEPFELKFKF